MRPRVCFLHTLLWVWGALFMLCLPSLQAQPPLPDELSTQPWQRCDTCWRYYDSTEHDGFRILAINANHWQTLRNYYGFDEVRLYGIYPDYIRGLFTSLSRTEFDPKRARSLLSWDSTVQCKPLNFQDQIDRDDFRYAIDSGMGVDAPLTIIEQLTNSCWTITNHPAFPVSGIFAHSIAELSPHIDSTDVTGYQHGLIWPVQISVSDTALIARGSRYLTQEGMLRGNDRIYTDRGWANRATFYRFSAAVNVPDTTTDEWRDIGPSEGIAYMVLRGRVRTGGQVASGVGADVADTICACYRDFDTIPITKQMYQDAQFDQWGYREVGQTINMAKSTFEVKVDSILLKTYTDSATGTQTVLTPYTEVRKTYTNLARLQDTIQSMVIGERDSIVQVVGVRIIDNTLPSGLATPCRVRETETYAVRYYTIEAYHAPIWGIPPGLPTYLYGYTPDLFRRGLEIRQNYDSCRAKFLRGGFAGGTLGDTAGLVLDSDVVAGSDIDIAVYSTGRVPLWFAGTRVSMDLYDSLKAGVFEQEIHAAIDSVYNDPDLSRLLLRPAVGDEPVMQRMTAVGHASRAMQRALYARNDTTRRLWSNLPKDPTGYRLRTGDYDSLGLKTLHLFSRQDYAARDSGLVPIYYLNPDSIAVPVYDTLGHLLRYDSTLALERGQASAGTHVIAPYVNITGGVVDTVTELKPRTFARRIAYNTEADYQDYTYRVQDSMLGTFHDRDVQTDQGAIIPTTARMVRDGKLQNLKLSPPTPVWNEVRPSFYPPDPRPELYRTLEHGGAFGPYWALLQTPEHMAAEAWLSLSCGVDGLGYADIVWDGHNVGFIDFLSTDHTLEYGQLYMPSATGPLTHDTLHKHPRMWVGMGSRSEAVRRVNLALKRLDSAIHLPGLVYRGEQISMHDPLDNLGRMPMVAQVKTQLAKRHDTTGTGGFIDSTAGGDPVYDAPTSTYLEVTHWYPGRRNVQEREEGSRFMLFVNRRTWPVDRLRYSRWALHFAADSLGDTVHTGDSVGFGAIDVRRPVVVLKNSTSVLADSMIVEKVLDTTWQVRAAVGAEVALDWLAPASGEMYRIRPIPIGVTRQATAWNNAVRSENTARDTGTGTRLVVYERDSAIWMRAITIDSLTAVPVWSPEWLVSDPTDTAYIGSGRWAHCMYPAVATVRNGQSALVVWERREQSGVHTVQALRFDSIPTSPASLATTNRFPLSVGVQLPDSLNQTPAIVGLRGGYLVSWTQPALTAGTPGVVVMAIRDTIQGFDMLNSNDAASISGIHSSFIIDSVTRYPTVAAAPVVRRYLVSDVIAATASITAGTVGTFPLLVAYSKPHQEVHLAYQQGTLNEANRQKIIYHTVGVDFTGGGAPVVALLKAEDVNADRPFCLYLHPSISCDSARVGVAYETVEHSHVITLRFRNGSFDPVTGTWQGGAKPWGTRFYEWGEWRAVMKPFAAFPVAFLAKNYTRPSLVHFPACDSQVVTSQSSLGMLAWQWENDSTGRHNRQYLYRYGQRRPDTLLDGHDPSMLIAPYVNGISGGVRAQSGVLHRGEDSTRVQRVRPRGDTVWGYPLMLQNTPQLPSALFRSSDGRGVVGLTSFTGPNPFVTTSLCGKSHDWRIDIGIHDRHGDGPDAPTKPGLPDGVHAPGGAPATAVTNVLEAASVLRTATFTVASEPVIIERMIVVGDSVIPSWLNAQPYDSALMRPADLGVATELVRDSDGVVLWRSDTLWTRVLGDTALVKEVEVPAQLWAPAGTEAYVRLRVITTNSLAVTPTAEVLYAENLPDAIAAKRARGPVVPETPRAGDAGLSVAVRPNPVRAGSGEVVIRAVMEGEVVVEVVDASGTPVTEPMRVMVQEGEVRVPFDAVALAAGNYTVSVQQGSRRVSTRLVVVR